MANIQHLRTVYMNEFFKSVKRAVNRRNFEIWEDPNDEMLDDVRCAIDAFERKLTKARTKNTMQTDRANHSIANKTNKTSNGNRLSPKRRKARKNASTTE